ncbi:MAG: hypothetical protein AAGL49_12785, partial [Pseudomonadota bacterium]
MTQDPSPARLIWTDGTTPRSAQFDDIYFSPTDGLGEAEHVFVSGSDLDTRFQTAQRFTIGELGFGTGLNFLAARRAWRRNRPAGSHLHYIAVEGFPLARNDLARALSAW